MFFGLLMLLGRICWISCWFQLCVSVEYWMHARILEINKKEWVSPCFSVCFLICISAFKLSSPLFALRNFFSPQSSYNVHRYVLRLDFSKPSLATSSCLPHYRVTTYISSQTQFQPSRRLGHTMCLLYTIFFLGYGSPPNACLLRSYTRGLLFISSLEGFLNASLENFLIPLF